MIDNRELLGLIARQMEYIGISCYADDIGGREAVVAEYSGDNDLPEDCTVTVEHLTEDTTEICLLITLMTGLDEGQVKDIKKVIGLINKQLRLGCFTVTDHGALFFEYAFVIDDEQETKNVLASFVASLDTVSLTAAEGKKLLLPLICSEIGTEDFSALDLYIEQ